MDVSIIIVNYFTSDLVLQAVDSIIKKSFGFTYEIVIVDNSNDDNELTSLRAKMNNLALIVNPCKNLGFGKANNLGSSFAKGKYIFFLNSDTLLMNNAIYELFVFMENQPNAGICGSNLFTKDLKPNHSFLRKEKTIRRDINQLNIFRNFVMKMNKKRNDFNYTDIPVEINGYVCGASLMIRAKEFNQIGGFDNRIFMYAEEALLCHHIIHKLGFRIYNVPSSKIVHYEGSSFERSISSHKDKLYIDGNALYYQILYGSKVAIKYLESIKKAYKRNRLFFSLFRPRSKEYFAAHESACNEAIKKMTSNKREE